MMEEKGSHRLLNEGRMGDGKLLLPSSSSFIHGIIIVCKKLSWRITYYIGHMSIK